MAAEHADRIEMQHRLFAELSRMFGDEVPLYNSSIEVNRHCNRAVCDMLARMYKGFSVSDRQMQKTSGERHGAIRIGRADEYRWVRRFFACFGMLPHNFYDMTSVGAKSQPVIATAFRSVVHPEHRVFASLLQTNYFDPETKRRVDDLLCEREVFSDEAKAIIKRAEDQGGLIREDAEALIREGTERIFKWTGQARDFDLYTHLNDAGFKIAAEIACFGTHHLNHLTPNTLCMDLYTGTMKRCMGERTEEEFTYRSVRALERLSGQADRYYLRLCFKHLTRIEIEGFERRELEGGAIRAIVDELHTAIGPVKEHIGTQKHNGFKDTTEGPSWNTPVFLRQDSYRALTEPVTFTNPDGSTTHTTHTARFGEIEKRFYATTPEGRALYDRCLPQAEENRTSARAENPEDVFAQEDAYVRGFEPIPKTLLELLGAGLVYAHYEPTVLGIAAVGAIETTDLLKLVCSGHVAVEGLRYEDFLPVSAAGIFASNLNEYGTKSTAQTKPEYTRAMLEDILGCPIVDSDVVYRGLQAASILNTYEALGLRDALDDVTRTRLESEAGALPSGIATGYTEKSVLAARA